MRAIHGRLITLVTLGLLLVGALALPRSGDARDRGEALKPDPKAFDADRRDVSKDHPRLFGSRRDLQKLAAERKTAYERMKTVAANTGADNHARMISLALVSAIEGHAEFASEAVRLAMTYVDGPIRSGHVTFGHDLALTGIVYDLCHATWTDEQRTKFHDYVNATVDANVNSETAVFHNGWYGYKHWGIGIAAYACYHENARAPKILEDLEDDYRTRAAPALEMAGHGGSWAEGYYVNYWLYEWLFFCEIARLCEGVDYYALAPNFYRHRAVCGMFGTYPGIREYGSRRPIPMGDGGGRTFGGDRDKALSSRRILVNRFRDDDTHRVVHAFNQTTPKTSVGNYAYKDFLWTDESVRAGDLARFRLSHISEGPGHVFARSSWADDATYFYFTCGDRFTAHQHLDVNHFLIARHEELLGDGGHYDGFGTVHDANYHVRSIAHNTMLVRNPGETWPDIRARRVTVNDGGQHHAFPHHNGSVLDPEQWLKQRDAHDIATLLAFQDEGSFVYVAGDATRAYASDKLETFVRQIVFVRPGTFVVFDRVVARQADFKKTFVLQPLAVPTGEAPNLVVTNGNGRLFFQTLLPDGADVKVVSGSDLYVIDGVAAQPNRPGTGAPQARIEVSPEKAAKEDLFVHVLTSTDASVDRAPQATVKQRGNTITITIGSTTIEFDERKPGGTIRVDGRKHDLADTVTVPGSD